MTNKQTLAERRSALLRIMSSPYQPSVTDAWNILKGRFPCSLSTLAEDWDRRYQWLPTVLHLDDSTFAVQCLESIREVARRAHFIYLRAEEAGNHADALNALRTILLAQAMIARFSIGRIVVNQTTVTMSQTAVISQSTEPSNSNILKQYQQALEKSLEEERMSQKSANQTNQTKSPENREFNLDGGENQ